MAQCITPLYVRNDMTMEQIPVRCGKCPPCLKARVSGWSFRLQQEEKQSDSALFVTLTYSTENVPITPKGFMTLRKRDVQLMFKRIRKARPKNAKPVVYYYCGEYGGKTMRPHYHLIVFNVDHQEIIDGWSYTTSKKKDAKRYALGNVHFGEVNGASISYCLKYMQKEGRIPLHANDDRLKEYSNMSKGIGANYLTPQMVRYHKKVLTRVYCTMEGNVKIPMPRYYRDKIYTENEKEIIAEYFRENAPEEETDDQKKWEKVQAQMHAFKTMYKDAIITRNKI